MPIFWGTRIVILICAWIFGESLIGKGGDNPSSIENTTQDVNSEIERLKEEIYKLELQEFNSTVDADQYILGQTGSYPKTLEEQEKNQQVIKDLKEKLKHLKEKQ